MELEAAPRQPIEQAAAAPVERQEAARLTGGRAGDLVTLDDDRPCATPACEIGNRGTDRATTADHDALARAHNATMSGPILGWRAIPISTDGTRRAEGLELVSLICIHVMRGLVPRIHVFRGTAKTWMAGTSPAMTACDSN